MHERIRKERMKAAQRRAFVRMWADMPANPPASLLTVRIGHNARRPLARI